MKKIGSLFWRIIEKIALWCLHLLFRVLHKEPTAQVEEVFLQFVRFGIVGVSNTVVHYVFYVGSLILLKSANLWQNYAYLIATAVGFVISVLWAFFWNNRFVFTAKEGEERSLWKSLIKTYISYSFTGLFLNSILMVLWVEVLHVSEFISPIFNLLLSVPINFLINKFWAFKKEER